jgi:PAS domain S-box-containing protein
VAKSQLDGATLVRTIRNTLAFHPQDQQTAPQSLRKLSRAVEQSADTIFVTDLHGVIEYVNPAFENLTGQDRDEVCGRTSRISKSSERAPEVYHEIWETILAGNSYRGIRGETNFLQKPCSLKQFSLKIRSALSHGASPAEKQHNR